MIVIYHQNNRVIRTAGAFKGTAGTPAEAIIEAAQQFPQEIIAWCDIRYQDAIDLQALHSLFRHSKMMVSYQSQGHYFPDAIGYSESTAFINVNKSVCFPTWQMSTAAGAVSGAVVNAARGAMKKSDRLGFFINAIAKAAMPLGVRCYSDPTILKQPTTATEHASDGELFCFIGTFRKKRWIWLTLFCMLIYEKRFPLFQAIRALFASKREANSAAIDAIAIPQQFEIPTDIDVLIPTIGRENFLRDFLEDLARQTVLPRKVIIAEQNPGGGSRLDFLQESWPFEVCHVFTQQPGVCNARNLALAKVSSSWIFLADDDIRISSDFLEQALQQIREQGGDVFNFACLLRGQKAAFTRVHQTNIFGAGCSFVSRKALGTAKFDLAYEFGYSEDFDFGRQLLDRGYDTLYLPVPQILHLKAPVGGFRTKPVQLWNDDPVQPKPAPTVLLYKRKHHTPAQVHGYRFLLFLDFYRHQNIRLPWKYFRNFNLRWNRSEYYANLLNQRNA